MAQKEAVMIILDVGRSMTTERRSSSWLDAAVRAVTLLVHQKILAGAKDEVGLILFGTEETKNDLAADGYNHVVVLRDIITPDVEFLREVENIRPGGADGDFVDALVVAMDLLVKKVGNRSYQKRIFLITDVGSDVNEDDLQTILDKFNEIDAVLNVIGVDFADVDAEQKQDRSGISETKEHNEKLIAKICERVKGRVIPIQNALDLLSFTSSKSVLQRSNFRGWFELSRHVRIPVWSFTKTKEDTFPRMTKISKLSQESANPDTLVVKAEKTYHPMDDPDKEVTPDNLSKGYRYGKSLVQYDKIDQQNLKFTSAAALQLLGFCRKETVPRHHFMSTVDAIVPLPTDETASQALSALIHAMINTDSVAIVRFVKRANSAPQLGVLTPHMNKSKAYECLHFNKLPFHEDIRQYSFTSLGAAAPKKAFVPKPEQLDAMEDLINSMDLTVNEKGEEEEALRPKRTYNPALQHFFSCVQSRALHPDRPMPSLDPIVDQYINPDKVTLERASRALESVKETFTLVRTEMKEKENRRRFWSDAFAEAAAGVQLDSYVNDDAKRQKLHDGLPAGGPRLSIQSLISEVTDVGSATPVEDFKAMLSRKDVDLVDKAIEQMQRQVAKLVNESIRDSHYAKARDCLKALREGCIEQAEIEPFNKFLADLKKNYRGGKRDDFWKTVCSDRISLITAEESSDSDITEAEAQEFLMTDKIPGHLESEMDGDEDNPVNRSRPANDEVEAEDLFDMIE